MSSNIRLSEKHGLNASMGICYYCGKEDGTIVLPGKLRGDVEAPRSAVWTKQPCPACEDLMRQGVMFISVKDGEQGNENPYRTGNMAVVRDSAVQNLIESPLREQVLKRRVVFVEDHVWKMLGLPTEEQS